MSTGFYRFVSENLSYCENFPISDDLSDYDVTDLFARALDCYRSRLSRGWFDYVPTWPDPSYRSSVFFVDVSIFHQSGDFYVNDFSVEHLSIDALTALAHS